MVSNGIKERFEFYRQWLTMFKVKEFMNLPLKNQEQFIDLMDIFFKDLHRIHEDCKPIKEKMITLTVIEISLNNRSKDYYTVFAKSGDSSNLISVLMPINKSYPKIGSKFQHTVYSIDGIVWYSSREELIIKI